jgi:hypothetical protein
MGALFSAIGPTGDFGEIEYWKDRSLVRKLGFWYIPL